MRSNHRVPVNGLTYHFLEWGDQSAPPVLMLHGLRSYAATWDPIAEALAGDYRLIAPDFRGRGDSSWDPEGDYFTNAYVADIKALVAALDLSRFVIIGHSMGGTVGYAYAARYPDQVAALVVEDIGPGSSTATSGADRVVREMQGTPRRFESLDDVHAYWRSIRPGISDDALQSRVDNTVRQQEDGTWAWKLDMAGIAAARLSGDPAGPVDLWVCVETLQCPTLVLRGAQSDFLTTEICEQMAQRQPLLRWSEIPAAGHYVHDDNADDYIAQIKAFLAEAHQ